MDLIERTAEVGIKATGWNPSWKGSGRRGNAALPASMVGICLSLVGVKWRNFPIVAIGGNPGSLTPTQVTGATGGIFQDSAGQHNVLLPGSSRFEQLPFIVRASGWVKLPAGTYTATLVAALYGVAGNGAWTAASGNQIALSGSQSYTQATTTALSVPWTIDAACEGDSTSAILQGRYQAIVNDVLTAATLLANKPTTMNFATECAAQFAAGVTLSNAQTGAICNLGSLYIFAD